MLNLQHITEKDVHDKLRTHIALAQPNSNEWCILNAALKMSDVYSFTNTRTYPRPDHPDPIKRKPLVYMMAAILISLRTTLENEQKAVLNLIAKFPKQKDLFKATPPEIESCIIPAGMANKKSITIRRAMDYVIKELNGNIEQLSKVPMTQAREKLLKIPGFGGKSTDCMLSIGLGHPSIAVDVNVFRTTSWLFNLPWSNQPDYADKKQVQFVKQLLDSAIPQDAFLTQIVHTYFLLYGKHAGTKHSLDKCLMKDYCMLCQKELEQSNQLDLFNSNTR